MRPDVNVCDKFCSWRVDMYPMTISPQKLQWAIIHKLTPCCGMPLSNLESWVISFVMKTSEGMPVAILKFALVMKSERHACC